MKRKQKMRQVMHRAAWRDVGCIPSWYQKNFDEEHWTRETRQITVQQTRSGRTRAPVPLLTFEHNGYVSHMALDHA